MDTSAKLGEAFDAVVSLGHYFEPGSAAYLVELLSELAILSDGVHRIKNLLSRLRSLLKIPPQLTLLIKPWKHQIEALNTWNKHGRKGIVSMATATGKTVVGLMAIQKLYEEHSKKRTNLRVLITAHSKAILNQWRREFIEKFGIPIQHSDYTIPIKFDNLIVEFKTIHKIIQSDNLHLTDLLIVDEVHHMAAPEFRKVLQKVISKYFLGLSASPDEGYRIEVFKELGLPIVYRYDLHQAIKDGILPEFEWILHKIPLSVEETREFFELSNNINKKTL